MITCNCAFCSEEFQTTGVYAANKPGYFFTSDNHLILVELTAPKVLTMGAIWCLACSPDNLPL